MYVRALLLASAGLAAAGAVALAQEKSTPPAAPYHSAIPAHDRRAFFGELHLHTVMSFDAWTFGTTLTPDAAYKFASGKPVMVSAYQLQREQGLNATSEVAAKRAWPLDFAAVTDHSEYLGAVAQIDIPGSDFAKSKLGQLLASGGRYVFFCAAGLSSKAAIPKRQPTPAAAAAKADGWNVEMRAANANYQPGVFTTFIGYEWTATPGRGVHMHRNVLFNTDKAPAPFTAVDLVKPEEDPMELSRPRARQRHRRAGHSAQLQLLRWPRLRLVHVRWQADGCDLRPPALSQRTAGRDRADKRRFRNSTRPLRQRRVRQFRGHGSRLRRRDAGRAQWRLCPSGAWPRSRGSVEGRAEPVQAGLAGGSDIHNGLSTSDESAFASSASGIDPATMLPDGEQAQAALDMTGQSRIIRPNGQRENDPLQYSSAAITGVWAEENTRNAIFAALKRRETFATSGTRIRVRMFGGWDFPANTLADRGWVAKAYQTGVAMGRICPRSRKRRRRPPSSCRR